MSAPKFTPGPWRVKVTPSSSGLEETGYAHQVLIGNSAHTVAHRWCKNFEHIHTEQIGNGYVRETGIGRIDHDKTPHPDAALIAAAPELFAALAETLEIATRNEDGEWADRARAALSKANPVQP